MSDEDLRARTLARGAPNSVADVMLGLYRASRNGEFAAVDPTLARLLARRPATMHDVIRQKIGA